MIKNKSKILAIAKAGRDNNTDTEKENYTEKVIVQIHLCEVLGLNIRCE